MTTTESSKPKVRTITLTDRPPVRVREDLWPVIASARRGDGAVECQDNHRWHLTVRRHATATTGDEYTPHEDGRMIVYGSNTAGPGGVHQGWEEARAGEMVEPGEDVAAVVRRVGERARCSEAMIDECIADLPAVDLDEAAPSKSVSMPREGATRLLAVLDRVTAQLRGDVSGWTIDFADRDALRAIATELRAALAKV